MVRPGKPKRLGAIGPLPGLMQAQSLSRRSRVSIPQPLDSPRLHGREWGGAILDTEPRPSFSCVPLCFLILRQSLAELLDPPGWPKTWGAGSSFTVYHKGKLIHLTPLSSPWPCSLHRGPRALHFFKHA